MTTMLTKMLLVLRRRRLLAAGTVLLSVVMAILAMYSAASAGPPVYESEHLLAVKSASSAAAMTPSQAVLAATRRDVPELAAKKLEGDVSPAELASRVTLALTTDFQAVSIRARAESAEGAEAAANAFAEAFIEFHSGETAQLQIAEKERLQTKIEAFDAEIEAITRQSPGLLDSTQPPAAADQQSRYDTVKTQRDQAVQQMSGLDTTLGIVAPYESLGGAPATSASSFLSSSPAPIRIAGAFAMTMLVGAVAILLLERLLPRLDTSEEAEAITELGVLAEIPALRHDQIITPINPMAFDGPHADAHRSLRTSLEFLHRRAALDRPPIILISSSSPGEGKTMTAAHLAIAIAETGKKVVLLSCDFRRPRLHDVVGAARDPGLNSGFISPEDLTQDVIRPEVWDNVSLVSSGPPTRRMVHLVPLIRDIALQAVEADRTVIIDTAPLLVANDTADLLQFVDQVVVIARPGTTRTRALQHSLELLRRNAAPIAGIVMIGVEAGRGRSYYDYDYGPESRLSDMATTTTA